jgi:2-polyprenyl-6-methoxyphenol hydroxylase-like FAD-dependent oxidoreductase
MFLFAGEPSAVDHRDRTAQQQFLRNIYANEGWEVPGLLAGAESAPDFYFDTMTQVHMDHWSAGRVALVGDAAYCASPASGQGTSLALVGGYVLAGEIAAAAGDHHVAFERYEELMRPFVAENQKLGPANIKRMVMRTKGQVRFSMRMLSLLAKMPGKDRMMAKVIAPIHRAATAIDLPKY